MNREHLRQYLLRALAGEGARMSFDAAIADFPLEQINARIPNAPYTFWHLLEHLRVTQRDILDYLIDPDYRELKWPDEYWPSRTATTDAEGWHASADAFRADLERLKSLAREHDLTELSPSGVSIYQQALLAADHNAYHIGELAILRAVMYLWPADHDT